MSATTLETLLSTCYPLSSTLFASGLLTVQELARLQQVSKTIRDIITGHPIPIIRFQHSFADDPQWEGQLGLWPWGIDAKTRIPDDDRDYDPSERSSRKFNSKSVWSAIKSVTPFQNIRKLYLDGCYVSSKFAAFLLSSDVWVNLEELSLVRCREVEMVVVAKIARENDRAGRQKLLKKLHIWYINGVEDLIWNAWANNDSMISPEEVQALREDLEFLIGRYELDTAICKNHEKLVPAPIRTMRCMGCEREQIIADCPMCLLKRTCEGCQGEYCARCNPWDSFGELTHRNLLSNDDDGHKTAKHKHEDEVAIAMCSFPDAWWHEGKHLYHNACSSNLPLVPRCKYCNKAPCRWQNSMSCGLCGAGICLDCMDHVMECSVCDTESCCEECLNKVTKDGSRGWKRCKQENCDFWTCSKCAQLGRIYTQGGWIWNSEHQMCKPCVDYFILHKDIRYESNVEERDRSDEWDPAEGTEEGRKAEEETEGKQRLDNDDEGDDIMA